MQVDINKRFEKTTCCVVKTKRQAFKIPANCIQH